MSATELVPAALVLAGAAFFLAGTVGLLRFPDVYSRLHALTKADNVGLGLVAFGLAARSGSARDAAYILFIWVLVLVATSAASHLMAAYALRAGIRPRGGQLRGGRCRDGGAAAGWRRSGPARRGAG